MPAAETRAERLLAAALTLFAASLPLSIAVAQSALTVAFLAWLACGRRGSRSRLLPPALLYAALTLLSAAASDTPLVSLRDSKELLQLAILAVVPAAATLHLRERLLRWFIAAATVSAVWGITHYLATSGGLANRARGPLGHYMTFAGVLLLATIAALARVLAPSRSHVGHSAPSRRERGFLLVALLPLLGAIACSFARNAWLGLAIAVPATFLLSRKALLPVVVAALAIALAAAPLSIRARAASIVSLEANRDRLEMWEVGADIVAEHPLLGLGPTRVEKRYADYTSGPVQPHLHNNFVQIAAERGLPALAAWIWLLARLARSLLARRHTGRRDGWEALGLGVLLALITGGLFEYNFGDSEVKMAFLLLASLALDGGSEPPGPTESA